MLRGDRDAVYTNYFLHEICLLYMSCVKACAHTQLQSHSWWPLDLSLQDLPVRWILEQLLEWVAMPLFRLKVMLINKCQLQGTSG